MTSPYPPFKSQLSKSQGTQQSRPWVAGFIAGFLILCLFLAAGLFVISAYGDREFSLPWNRPIAKNLQEVFEIYDEKGASAALSAAQRGDLRVAANYFEWKVHVDESGPDRARLAFALNHLDWPFMPSSGRNLLIDLSPDLPPQQVLDMDALLGGESLDSQLTRLAALDRLNLKGSVREALIPLWTSGRVFDEETHTLILDAYGDLLSPSHHEARFHRLLAQSAQQKGLPGTELTRAAALMRDLVSDDLDLVRVAWATGTDEARQAVPAAWQTHAALLTRLAWEDQDQDTARASALFRSINPETRNFLAEWRLRRILIRNAIREGSYGEAYELAATHGLGTSTQGLTAELLAGWIVLTYTNLPGLALDHYRKVAQAAPGPWIKSKALRGQARAEAALNFDRAAQTSLQACAAFETTFYALLCAEDLGAPLANPRNPIKQAEPNPIFEDIFAVANMLVQAERPEFEVFPFAVRLFDMAKNQDELLRVARLFSTRDDLAFTHTQGVASRRGTSVFFPQAQRSLELEEDDLSDIEVALALAVIAQESQFRPSVRSPAGAVGLMQLLPSTAEQTAAELGLAWSPALLTTPEDNVKLGSAYLTKMLDRYEGALLPALAAYNAGPSNADRWMEDFGDPRTDEILPEDWIDALTIGETRLYVQRVLTNLYLYRAAEKRGDVPIDLQTVMTAYDRPN